MLMQSRTHSTQSTTRKRFQALDSAALLDAHTVIRRASR